MISFAATSWPDAAVAIAGVTFAGSVIVVVVWQLMATWRARMGGTQALELRRIAEDASAAQSRTAVGIEQTLAELRSVDQRMGELERVLKEVG